MLFAGIDRAILGATLARRLTAAGLAVPLSATNRFVRGLEAVGPLAKPDLYWLARTSLVSDHRDLPLFDRVFAAVFDSSLDELKAPGSRRAGPSPSERPGDDALVPLRVSDADAVMQGHGLPWATLPSVGPDDDDGDADAVLLPERLPSDLAAEIDTPFDLLDPNQLAAVEELLADALETWPTRTSRRHREWSSGRRVELRGTLRSAYRTGGEPFRIHRTRRRSRPRRVVMVVDVSGSMQSFTRPYLHLTRALVMAGRAEVFAFATDVTRISASLRHRSAVEAIDRASEEVTDRFGGTRLASSLRRIQQHPTWGGLLRGAILVIASDGWDTDPAADTEREMAKLARRTHRIIWLNPRSADPRFEPRVASMAAALPYCTVFLSGHSLRAMTDVINAIAR